MNIKIGFFILLTTTFVSADNLVIEDFENNGEDFCYNEMLIQGSGEEGKAAADFVSSINPLGDAPKPGDGPSRESRENGNYDILFCADIDNESIHASVAGDMDPGYGSTSKMILESALCLVNDCPELKGGIYTTASS